MSADRIHSPTSTSPPQRRPSLSPNSFGDIFSKPNSANRSNSTGNSFHSPITTAAATNAQSNRRRMSITTLGLSGSPTQPSQLNGIAGRRESLSSSESFEDAIDDSDNFYGSSPTSPFARRVSFGAQALRDVRGGNSTGHGRYTSSGSSPLAKSYHTASSANPTYTRDNHPSSLPSSSSSSSAAADISSNYPKKERSDRSWRPPGEGFNWSAALRTRAERAPSVGGSFSSASAQPPSLLNQNDPQALHQRAASIAIMEEPTREIPKEPAQKKPDFFQEKILRADFMD